MVTSPTTHSIYSPHRNASMSYFIPLCILTVVIYLGYKVSLLTPPQQNFLDQGTEPDQEDES
jgi:hypothetical protein